VDVRAVGVDAKKWESENWENFPNFESSNK
jgi:hypothetical protein